METTKKAETFDERIERERKERQALFVMFADKMETVAKLLGGRLKEEKPDIDGGVPYSFSREILLPDGSLWVSAETYGNKKHFHFSGIYPKTAKGEYIRPYGYGETPSDSINVSRTKNAEQIARDVTRRLLPEYALRLAKVREMVADYDGFHEKQRNAIKAVADGSGLTASDHRENGIIQFEFVSPSADDKEGRGDVEPLGRGTVKMTLSYVSPEQAVKILDILNAKQ